MISLCPTVTADTADEYGRQIAAITALSRRIHVDAADGVLAPRQLLPLADCWWPGGVQADLHLMYQRPLDHLAAILALKPQLVIVHAEAEGSFIQLSNSLRAHGIEAGVALQPDTPVSRIEPALEYIDHVLIFSGNLGYQGGSAADLSLLAKAVQLKQLKPQLELGWDGGINATNLPALIAGGIQVANIGGFLQHAPDMAQAWQQLVTASQA